VKNGSSFSFKNLVSVLVVVAGGGTDPTAASSSGR
jgi:uncharacterized protein with von Willebrand factor type A (vWA) domain